MTVASETILESHACNGTTGPFAFNFKVFDDDDLLVIKVDSDGVETELTKDAAADGYTVAMDGSYPNTGEITLTDAYDATHTLKIILWMDLLQGTSLPSTGTFSTKEVEYAMDKLCKQVQKLYHLVSRAVTFVKSSSSEGIGMFPEPEALKYPRWNAGATALENAELTALADMTAHVADAQIHHKTAQAVSIDSGVLDLSSYAGMDFFTVSAEAGTEDTLTQITGMAEGDKITLKPAAGHTITIQAGADICMAGDFIMASYKDRLELHCDGSDIWVQMSRAVNA